MPESHPTVVVLTALPIEYNSVRARIEEAEELVHDDGTRVERGRLAGTDWTVAVAELGEGAVNTAALTTQIVSWLRPEALFFVGVADGLKGDVDIGDVVIGTKVYAVQGGRQTTEGFHARPEVWHGSHRLVQAARAALREMAGVRGHLKPIACGDVVLADDESTFAEHIRRAYNDAYAIELEGSGAAHAAHLNGQLDALVIRGISDHADARRAAADTWGCQARAAEQAAEALVVVLRKLWPSRGRSAPSGSEDSQDSQEEPFPAPRTGETPSLGGTAPFTGSSTPSSPDERDAGTPGGRETESRRVPGPVPEAAALPAVPAGFTGRDDDLRRLLPALDPAARSDLPVVIFAVSGLGGIGKTSFALHAAHEAVRRGWFRGGTIFVDLRGYDDAPVTAEQALLALLDGLGIRGAEVPPTPNAQYEFYRSLLARKSDPMLLILDNVSDPAQITPLFPETRRHRVLITSRDRLTDLAARLLDLDTLKPKDSEDLIDKSLRLSDERDVRASGEPDSVAELCSLCGHHPLALRIAVGMLRKSRHRSIAWLVGVLNNSDDRTERLGLRPVFDASYRQLPQDQAQLLRLLALAPTAGIGEEAAEALAGLGTDETIVVLDALSASHLVTPVQTDGVVRWQMHSLVREYAARIAVGNPELVKEGETARERLLEFYYQRARQANDALSRLPGMPKPDLFRNRAEALAWLNRERAALVAVVQWAQEQRYTAKAVWLSELLAEYLASGGYFDDWITVSRAAQQACERTKNKESEAVAWGSLGRALVEVGQTEEAIHAHIRAKAIFQCLGDRNGEGSAWDNLGVALWQRGLKDEAIGAHTQARNIFQATGDLRREAIAWENVGNALREKGPEGERMAIAALRHAIADFQIAQDGHGEASARNSLGLGLWQMGRKDEAYEEYHRALELNQAYEDWYRTGLTLLILADAHESEGRTRAAHARYLEAVELFTRADALDRASEAQSAADALT